MPRIWQRGSDGKLTWSSLNPLQKDALAVLAKWHKDGILDPDWMTQNDAGKYLGGNQFGMAPGAWWYSVWALRTSVANDATADWTFALVPAGPGGKRGRWGDPMTGTTTCFRKGIDPIKIEAVINTLNWWYEIEDNNLTATTGGTLVFLGYDYVMEGEKAVNGKFNTTRYNPGGLDFNLKGYPEFDNVGYNRGALQKKMDPKLLNPLQQLWSQDAQILLGAAANNTHFTGVKYRMVTDFVWPPPTNMLETIQALTKIEDEAYSNIISGKQPISAWDTFVQDWKKQGGDKLTAAINEEDAKHK
jgi:putative aldouronate transport system substrate-binding protein